MTGEQVRIPADFLRLLKPLAEQAGLPLPDGVDIVPEINLDDQVIRIGEQLGGLLARCDIYVRGSQVVSIEDGRAVPVSAQRFCSLIEEWVTCIKATNNGRRVVSMGKDLAGKVLECRQFTRRLPVLEHVLPVRIPYRNAAGEVVLLKKGYNEACRAYCLDQIAFDEAVPVGKAMGVLEDYFSEYQFADLTDKQGNPLFSLWQNRSFCAQMGAMLTIYGRLLLDGVRPMHVWVANQQGSGKSVCAEAPISVVFGDVSATNNPEDRNEMNKLLDTTAQSLRPYLFLDDAPAFVASGALNSFLTRKRHSGRILGTSTEFDEPNVTAVLLTGNNIELTADLLRRSSVIELFLPGEIEGREFKRTIDPGFWAKTEVRAEMLGALWAMVRHWAAGGCKGVQKGKPTFEQWSHLVGGIVASLPVLPVEGFHIESPVTSPDLPMSGDRRGQEWRQLLGIMASDVASEDYDPAHPPSYTTSDIVAHARKAQLLEDLVGVDGDKPINDKALRRMGSELKKWRGRVLVDAHKRSFQFGARRQEKGTVYPLTFTAL